MFLDEPDPNPSRERMYAGDLKDDGYVMNLTRAWAWRPELREGPSSLLAAAVTAGGLSMRQRALLVTAAASGLGDSYCSLARGTTSSSRPTSTRR